jgi:hypothetical protein
MTSESKCLDPYAIVGVHIAFWAESERDLYILSSLGDASWHGEG